MTAAFFSFFLLAIFTMPYPHDGFSPAFPGDLRRGNGPDFGWDKQSAEWQMSKRNIEINNGRAAMMGILGLVVHESLGNLNEIIAY